jgi:hypothetical protein
MAVLCVLAPLRAGDRDPDRDFSGIWVLDRTVGDYRQIAPPEETLVVTQNDRAMGVAAGHAQWVFPLDGTETKYRVQGERWSSATKWEGSALLINTLVMGPRDYTIMDRWRLSADRRSLSVTRQVVRGSEQVEGTIVYRRR